MIVLSLLPGLGYVFLAWLHDIPLRAIIWYIGIVVISVYGYRIYRQYKDETLTGAQLKAWYKNLSNFYYVFILLWLLIFLLFITEDENHLHYIAIFTEIGASVVASVLLMPDKKLFKPSVLVLMIPLAIYFLLINEWYGYVLALFSTVLMWVLIYAAESSHKLLLKTNFQANHDFLTGLKNRYYFINYLQNMMAGLKNANTYSYLLLIDLDHFKTINDSLGHDVGDQLLQQVSERITEEKDQESLLARLGGDEFVVVGLEYNNFEECKTASLSLAERILKTLKKNHEVGLHNLYISASIGVSLINGDPTDANHLIKEADIAMYEAKDNGRDGVIVFDGEMEKRVDYNLEIERLLYFAIDNNEVSLVFQPQLDQSERVIGVEALARWNSNALGNIPPDVFIPIAEKTGSIIVLGHFIMEQAFQAIKYLHDNGVQLQQFSINVSMRQFFYYDFIKEVSELCDKYLTDELRHKIVFEITESIVAEDIEKVVLIMKEIKRMGIRFSMDDFGTGYSSLSYLKRLPIDEIKIDRSFVSELSNELNDQVMVKSVLDMAKHFDISVVAEGIEEQEQLDFLRENECDFYQGYFYARPMSQEELIKFYKAKQ